LASARPRARLRIPLFIASYSVIPREEAGRHRIVDLQSEVIGMATLQQQIAEKFIAKLAKSKNMNGEKIEQLRSVLADNKKLKAEEFINIFSLPNGGGVK
jgi:hypothetical protein